MIACDASPFSAFLKSEDVLKLTAAIIAGELYLPPVVSTEITSDSKAGPTLSGPLAGIGLPPILDGFRQRAGNTRRTILALD